MEEESPPTSGNEKPKGLNDRGNIGNCAGRKLHGSLHELFHCGEVNEGNGLRVAGKPILFVGAFAVGNKAKKARQTVEAVEEVINAALRVGHQQIAIAANTVSANRKIPSSARQRLSPQATLSIPNPALVFPVASHFDHLGPLLLRGILVAGPDRFDEKVRFGA